jgi:hypothetical protein
MIGVTLQRISAAPDYPSVIAYIGVIDSFQENLLREFHTADYHQADYHQGSAGLRLSVTMSGKPVRKYTGASSPGSMTRRWL